MKINLPKNNKKGFTLIELMVVVTIIAILAVVGLTLFNNTQRRARDATRQREIDAISKAMESYYAPLVSTINPVTCPSGAAPLTSPGYCDLDNTMFADNVVPDDPLGSNGQYCFVSSNLTSALASMTPDTNSPYQCVAPYAAALDGVITPGTGNISWKFCVSLEATAQVYCIPSAQQ